MQPLRPSEVLLAYRTFEPVAKPHFVPFFGGWLCVVGGDSFYGATVGEAFALASERRWFQ